MSNNYNDNESNGNRNKTSIEECLDKIKPDLKDIITSLKKSDTWKIQLAIAINFVSHRETDEDRVMHWTSDKI